MIRISLLTFLLPVSLAFSCTNLVGRRNVRLNVGSVVDKDLNNPVEIVEEKKTYLDDGFVFGLEDSGLERPKGKAGESLF